MNLKKLIGTNKDVLIFFTGGFDSTYLLEANLKAGNRVTCIYTKINNNETKTKAELAVIDEIIEVLNRKYSVNLNIIVNEIMVSGGSSVALPQVPVHIFSALYGIRNHYSSVQIGYCMNDDAISFLSEIKKAYNSFQPMFDFKMPNLIFPLMQISKYEMITDFSEELLKLVYSCENDFSFSEIDEDPILEPCGKCVPCKKYLSLAESDYRFNYATRLIHQKSKELKLVASQEPLDDSENFFSKVMAADNIISITKETSENNSTVMIKKNKFKKDNN